VAHFGQSFTCTLTSSCSVRHGSGSENVGHGKPCRGRRQRHELRRVVLLLVVGSLGVGVWCAPAASAARSQLFLFRSPAILCHWQVTRCCSPRLKPAEGLGHGLQTPARASSPGRWDTENEEQQRLAGPLPQPGRVRCHTFLCLFASLSHCLRVSGADG